MARAFVLVFGLPVLVVPGAMAGEAMPYPQKDCRILADDLAVAGPLPKPYKIQIQWFRDGELGIKGNQCRISAKGVARKDKDTKVRPGIVAIANNVIRVLKSHGFKGDKLMKRYKRDGAAYRSFALRKDRATCWTNLESEDVAASPEEAAKKSKAEKSSKAGKLSKALGKKPAPVWLLTVDCFLG